MAKYILVYKNNEPTDWAAQPPEQVKKIVNAWGEWAGSMGKARKESMPFKFGGKSVGHEGTQDADNLLTGFAVIEAEDFDEALHIAQSAPSVVDGTGRIEIYEAFAF